MYKEIYRYLAYRIVQRQDAEDAVARVFMKAWEKLNGYDPARGSLREWLMGIAKNEMKMYWRGRRPTCNLDDLANLLVDTSSEYRVALLDDERAVAEIFAMLGDEEKALLAMHYLDGMTYEEIAAIVDARVPAIRKRVSRTLAILRETFTEIS